MRRRTLLTAALLAWALPAEATELPVDGLYHELRKRGGGFALRCDRVAIDGMQGWYKPRPGDVTCSDCLA